MKTLHFSLVIGLGFLFGCASTNPKVSTSVKSDAWTVFFPPQVPPEVPIKLGQFQWVDDEDLRYALTNFEILNANYCPRPPQLQVSALPIDYSRKDISLIDDVNTLPIDLK